jgi:gliding motility-associated lipoprotein GldK
MDESEITNSEYKQFVYWVRDSVTRTKLAYQAEFASTGEEDAAGNKPEFAFKDADTADQSPFPLCLRENYYDLSDDPYAGRPLNWDQSLDWDPNSYIDEAYVEVMDSLYLPPEVWYNGEMKIDVNKLIYKYSWFDAEAASLERAKNPQSRDRLPFIKKEEIEILNPYCRIWIDFNFLFLYKW